MELAVEWDICTQMLLWFSSRFVDCPGSPLTLTLTNTEEDHCVRGTQKQIGDQVDAHKPSKSDVD